MNNRQDSSYIARKDHWGGKAISIAGEWRGGRKTDSVQISILAQKKYLLCPRANTASRAFFLQSAILRKESNGIQLEAESIIISLLDTPNYCHRFIFP